MQEPRTRPVRAEDFHRPADLAHERGLRVFEVGANRWFCTSHSDPFALHVVTGFSCDCQGFLHHQRCTHRAALLAHLGWLPELEDEAPAPAHCPDCTGCGVIVYRRFEEPCSHCGGSGVRPDHRLRDVPAVEIVATITA